MLAPRRSRPRALSDAIADRVLTDADHQPKRAMPRRAALRWEGGAATRTTVDEPMPAPRRAVRTWLPVAA